MDNANCKTLKKISLNAHSMGKRPAMGKGKQSLNTGNRVWACQRGEDVSMMPKAETSGYAFVEEWSTLINWEKDPI